MKTSKAKALTVVFWRGDGFSDELLGKNDDIHEGYHTKDHHEQEGVSVTEGSEDFFASIVTRTHSRTDPDRA